jgi:phosphoesterase RecJ-like protein
LEPSYNEKAGFPVINKQEVAYPVTVHDFSADPDFIAFREALSHVRTICISAHVGPDGDTLGSMLGIRHAFLKNIHYIERIDCLVSGRVPDTLSFLPDSGAIISVDKTDTSQLPKQYDMAISVDCGSSDRLGVAQPWFESAPVRVNIDHHISNKRFGTINLVVTDAAASGQVVADLLEHLSIPLDADTAQCLYTALVSDTGGFKYSNTTAAVFDCALRLVKAGATPEPVFKALYEIQPMAQFQLHAEALAQAQFNTNATIGWTSVTQAMLTKHGALEEHTDGLVESIRRIDSVMIACVLRETAQGHTKVSLRSDHDAVDVAAIVEDLGGGGHRKAAGCTIELPPAQAQQKLLPLLEQAVQAAGF